jgi:glycerophosphoryl diester phosphodiesterase
MIVIGHRGSAGNEPENTLRSIVRAVEDGADVVELDVHLTKDGRLAVIHDAEVNRTTNGKGKVAEMTLEELGLLDAGKGEKVPSLEEAIEAVDQRIPINIELKALGTAQAVRDLIEFYVTEGWNRRDFMVSSFEHNELHFFSSIAPDVKIGVLTGEVPFKYAQIRGSARRLFR